MNYLLRKITSVSLALIFLLTPLNVFAYSLQENNELFDEQINLEIEEVYNEFSTYELDETSYYNQYERAKITITVASIRAALARMGASSSFIPMTDHALIRVNERGFTADSIARLMHNGRRFTDITSNARILHDHSNRLALILDRFGNVTVTALDRVNISNKPWVPGWFN